MKISKALHGGSALGLGLVLIIVASALADPQTQPTPSALDTLLRAGVSAFPDTLTLQHRIIFIFRATIMGLSPAERAEGARQRLEKAIALGEADSVHVRSFPQGRFIFIGEIGAFMITPGDVDSLAGETIDEVSQRAVENLTQALRAEREQRSLSYTLKAIALTLLATAVLVFLLRAILRGHRYLSRRLEKAASAGISKIGLQKLTEKGAKHSLTFLRRLVDVAAWALGLFLTYTWLVFSLRRFPQTRPIGDAMRSQFISLFKEFALAIAAAIPDLIAVVLIFILARFLAGLVKRLFALIETGQMSVSWAHPETAQPTRRVIVAILWLFALVMAYPYLPGSDSEAFKGIGVLVGLMLSLGSAGLVNQAMSGFALMYSRAFRVGDYVRIGDTEGVVTALNILSTKIKTPKREEVTLPNSVVTGTTVKNFSRLAANEGVILYTTVTIGYSTPWRQVHALLLAAAERTPGLKKQPPPFVNQTALSDFYVEYQLNAYLEKPESRVHTLSLLHANIQDAFNEFGVQIMSPHYEADPPAPVLVPKEKWHEAPALPASESKE